MLYSRDKFILNPRFTARMLAFLIALIFSLSSFFILKALIKNENLNTSGAGDKVENSEAVGSGIVNPSELIIDEAKEVGNAVNARSAVICSVTGSQVLAKKEMNTKLPIKDAAVFMTAYAVSKAVNEGKVLLTDYAVCPASAAKYDDYSLTKDILPIGKRMQIEDILKCMLYQSGTAYSYTLAVHIFGSEENLVTELNAIAREWGLSETEIHSCYSLSEAGGYTSAYDLAVIVKKALGDPLISGIFSSSEQITVGYGQSQSVSIIVKNDFFERYCTVTQAQIDGIRGGKIGIDVYSTWSVIAFVHDEETYVSVILESKDPFADALILYSAYVLP